MYKNSYFVLDISWKYRTAEIIFRNGVGIIKINSRLDVRPRNQKVNVIFHFEMIFRLLFLDVFYYIYFFKKKSPFLWNPSSLILFNQPTKVSEFDYTSWPNRYALPRMSDKVPWLNWQYSAYSVAQFDCKIGAKFCRLIK